MIKVEAGVGDSEETGARLGSCEGPLATSGGALEAAGHCGTRWWVREFEGLRENGGRWTLCIEIGGATCPLFLLFDLNLFYQKSSWVLP